MDSPAVTDGTGDPRATPRCSVRGRFLDRCRRRWWNRKGYCQRFGIALEKTQGDFGTAPNDPLNGTIPRQLLRVKHLALGEPLRKMTGEVTGRLIVDGDGALETLMQNVERGSAGLSPSESWEGLRQQVPGIVRACVDAITHELSGVDLWNVLEAIRQITSPSDLGTYRESENTNLPVIVEVIALVGLSQAPNGRQQPDQGLTTPLQFKESVEKIHAAGYQIVQLAQVVAFASSEDVHLGKAAELTGILRAHEVTVRGRNYLSMSRSVVSSIFGAPHLEKIVEEKIGYTHEDVVRVWEGIQKFRSNVHEARIERMDQIAQEWAAGKPQSSVVVAEGRQIFHTLLQGPGRGMVFTPSDISAESGVMESSVRSILKTFSIAEISTSAYDACAKFVDGENLLAGKGMIRDGDNFMLFGDPIPHDYVRPVMESLLKPAPGKSAKDWERYKRHRDGWAEDTAASALAYLLGVGSPTFSSLKYRAPNKTGSADLSQESENPKLDTHETEADALFVIDDVAVCVEVKAGSITDKARTGNVRRVETDLRKTIGEASEQASRLEGLIRQHGGLWQPNGKWLDLEGVREIHSVVVCLDDWGPLAIATDALVRAGFINGSSVPWLVSLHDLEVIKLLFQRPADFLTYLRRRTDPVSSRLIVAADELDLVMWYIDGDMYIEPDPDQIHELHPMTSPPTAADRRRFAASNVPTRVSTLTDRLDAWMYYSTGQTGIPAVKPLRKHSAFVSDLLDFLQAEHKPGWLRFGADLAGLSGVAQQGIGNHVKRLVAMTRDDGGFHSSIQNFPGPWGHPVLFMGSKPERWSLQQGVERLAAYGTLKKYQLHGDRSLELLFDTKYQIVSVRYLNDPYVHSEHMDQRVIESKLVAPARMPKAVPPSARRSTVRLKPTKKKKR